MGKSPFFARIKNDVLKIVLVIPTGKCCTYGSIGEHLDVAPRHVAYILATLSDAEKSIYPWYRVVGNDGLLGQLKSSEWGTPQSILLEAEGVLVTGNKIIISCHQWFISAQDLNSGVVKQFRPSNAPLATGRLGKRKAA
jgi:methylated-DNA-protein-cysteine methyltransferase-like protein